MRLWKILFSHFLALFLFFFYLQNLQFLRKRRVQLFLVFLYFFMQIWQDNWPNLPHQNISLKIALCLFSTPSHRRNSFHKILLLLFFPKIGKRGLSLVCSFFGRRGIWGQNHWKTTKFSAFPIYFRKTFRLRRAENLSKLLAGGLGKHLPSPPQYLRKNMH